MEKGDEHVVVNDSSCSGGAHAKFIPHGESIGDSVTYTIAISKPGTYRVKVGAKAMPD